MIARAKKRSRWNDSDDDDQIAAAKPKSNTTIPVKDPVTHIPPIPSAIIHARYPRPLSVVPCAKVDKYQKLNKIDEGAYGIVYRAKCTVSGDIVALKRLKLDQERHGFPITAIREISTLLQMRAHKHIVHVREIVVGTSLTSVFMVMDFIEHDLKSLLSHLRSSNLKWTMSEIKTLMTHLLLAVLHLHSNSFLHRDLKSSNLLLSNQGILKVADFGLIRRQCESKLTPLVVTLWYRAPELLFGAAEYDYAIDMWSVGCIFAELFTLTPLFPGQGEIDQVDQILQTLGAPPLALTGLPNAMSLNFARYGDRSNLSKKVPGIPDSAFRLLSQMLEYDPSLRTSAKVALDHPYFRENPPPKDPRMFPTFPSRANGEINQRDSPSAPHARHGEVGSILDPNARSTSYTTVFGDSVGARLGIE